MGLVMTDGALCLEQGLGHLADGMITVLAGFLAFDQGTVFE